MAARARTSPTGVAVLVLLGIGLFAVFCLVMAAMLGHTAQLAYADWLAMWLLFGKG